MVVFNTGCLSKSLWGTSKADFWDLSLDVLNRGLGQQLLILKATPAVFLIESWLETTAVENHNYDRKYTTKDSEPRG